MSDSTERFGELMVVLGVLTEQQVEEILEYQKIHSNLLFGQIAVKLNFLTEEKLREYF